MTDMAMASEQTGRKRRTAEERRRDVLAAAVIEFATYGLHGASTEAIAGRAGISQPYVLRLFGTKKQLFLDACDHVGQEILSIWRRTPVGDGPPAAKLAALGRAFNPLVEQRYALRLLLQGYASAADPDVRDQSRAWMRRMHAFIQETTGANEPQLQAFFATGMLLMVAASLGADEIARDQAWARTFLSPPSL